MLNSLYTNGENAKNDKRTENLETIMNLRNRTGEETRRLTLRYKRDSIVMFEKTRTY